MTRAMRNLQRASVSGLLLPLALVACPEVNTDPYPGPPAVQSVSPADGAIDIARDVTLTVTFSEPMSAASGAVTFSPAMQSATSWAAEGTELRINPAGEFPAGTEIMVTLTNYEDQLGTDIEQPYV